MGGKIKLGIKIGEKFLLNGQHIEVDWGSTRNHPKKTPINGGKKKHEKILNQAIK